MTFNPCNPHPKQDKITSSSANENELKNFSEYYEKNNPRRNNIEKVIDFIQLDGVPGSDKPILAQTLFVLLKQAYFMPLSIDRSHTRDDDECLAKVTDAVLPISRLTHLILDGMLVDKSTPIRSEGLQLAVTVLWSHTDVDSRIDAACSESLANDSVKHNGLDLQGVPASADERETRIERSPGNPPTSTFEDDELSTGPVVMLDMSLTLPQMIQEVWDCLEKNGKHKLPNLKTFNVEAALNIAREYGKLCCPRNHVSLPIYASIVIEDPNSRLLPHIRRKFLTNKIVQGSFHVTTKYFGGIRDDFMLAQLLTLHNQKIELTLLWVLSDLNGTAVVVRNQDGREFPCDNYFAHITIANRRGIPPKYSNDLCFRASLGKTGAENYIHIVKLPPQTTVSGIFSFHYGY
ncbi:unnamed protein product [Phytomonas sp. EM1]|nr:unnamed protein product [Phytomonas sp. EM1]|eukprot:CCW65191.1 unnamed protein product [Phytomonas sp. isolate EM1]